MLVAAVLCAAAPAAAQASAMGGGSRWFSVSMTAETPDLASYMGETLVSCPGDDVTDVYLHGSGALGPGGSFSISGTRHVRRRRDRLTVRYRLVGTLGPTSGSGRLVASATRRRHGHVAHCGARHGAFQVRPGGPEGTPAPRPPALPLYGVSDQLLYGVSAPVTVLRWHRRVWLRWVLGTSCRNGGSLVDPFANVTPTMRPNPRTGAFSRHERFTVRYADVTIRYRADTTGRFTATGAAGTVRLRATVRTHRGRVLDHCGSGVRHWGALA